MKNQFTRKISSEEFDAAFIQTLDSICESIAQAGLDPYSQLMGFILTGEDCYITRTGNARAMIRTLDRSRIRAYVKSRFEK